MIKPVLLAAVALAAMTQGAAAIGCKDESGDNVDWWAAFKYPNDDGYSYVDANSRGGWEASRYHLQSSSSGAHAHTLQQLYGNAPNTLFYNDEPPNGAKASSGYGHTKGALGFDSDSGFWLIHSTPRSPDNTPSSYPGFPDDELKYGQSFLCVTYDYQTFNDIGTLLQNNRPKIYAQTLTSSAQSDLPNFAAALAGTYNHDANLITKRIYSSGGKWFQMFAKTQKWGQDLYNQGVSPQFGEDTYAETWMNGVGPLPSYCTSQGYQYNTLNIRDLNISNVAFKETQDHSKYAITAQSTYVCIGDINRQHGQLGRPGGTACFDHMELWHSIKEGITDMDKC